MLQDDSTVCAKINQDRGCIVHPFMGDPTALLACVFDGHGESGDKVSKFAMLGECALLTDWRKSESVEAMRNMY